jgi:hypothetical protein
MVSDLAEKFRAVDGGLRLVVRFASTDWELEYIREDLESTYSAEDFEETYREHMASQVSAENMSEVIVGGDFAGKMFMFEDIVVFQFPSSRYEGLFVSYDWRDSFPTNDVFRAADSLPEHE